MSDFKEWLGKVAVFQDQVNCVNMERFYHTLELSEKPPKSGESIPEMALLMLANPAVSSKKTGIDGHPERGIFVPPIPLKRRMLAGGNYEFYQPLRVDDVVNVKQTITAINQKKGQSGELIFVQIQREFSVLEKLCAKENQTVVYTDSEPIISQSGRSEIESEWVEIRQPNSLQLFRYSALTFNGHRIHYDQKYAQESEGYPGIVVHGPLLGTMLSLMATQNTGRCMKQFNYRGKNPVFLGETITLTGEMDGEHHANLSVLNHNKQLAMQAEAIF